MWAWQHEEQAWLEKVAAALMSYSLTDMVAHTMEVNRSDLVATFRREDDGLMAQFLIGIPTGREVQRYGVVLTHNVKGQPLLMALDHRPKPRRMALAVASAVTAYWAGRDAATSDIAGA